MTSDDVVYIVDWDLPANPSSRRRRFYRRLNKLCRAYDPEWIRSTFSVLRTKNRDFAFEVYLLALRYGEANLYEARILERR